MTTDDKEHVTTLSESEFTLILDALRVYENEYKGVHTELDAEDWKPVHELRERVLTLVGAGFNALPPEPGVGESSSGVTYSHSKRLYGALSEAIIDAYALKVGMGVVLVQMWPGKPYATLRLWKDGTLLYE